MLHQCQQSGLMTREDVSNDVNSLRSNLPGRLTFHNGRIISDISPLIWSAGSSAQHHTRISGSTGQRARVRAHRLVHKQADLLFIWLALLPATVPWFPRRVRSASARRHLCWAGSSEHINKHLVRGERPDDLATVFETAVRSVTRSSAKHSRQDSLRAKKDLKAFFGFYILVWVCSLHSSKQLVFASGFPFFICLRRTGTRRVPSFIPHWRNLHGPIVLYVQCKQEN